MGKIAGTLYHRSGLYPIDTLLRLGSRLGKGTECIPSALTVILLSFQLNPEEPT